MVGCFTPQDCLVKSNYLDAKLNRKLGEKNQNKILVPSLKIQCAGLKQDEI